MAAKWVVVLEDVAGGTEPWPVPLLVPATRRAGEDAAAAALLAARIAAVRAVEYEPTCVLSATAAAESDSRVEGDVSALAGTADGGPGGPLGCACVGVCDPIDGRCHHGHDTAPDTAYDPVVYACRSPTCACAAACPLRRAAPPEGGGIGVPVRVVDLGADKGWGVVTDVAVPPGAYVCEYAGEVVTLADAQRRWQTHTADASDSTYVLCVREHRGLGQSPWTTVVDATETGNVARYLNHSCGPNLVVVPVRVPGDGPRPLLALFAKRAIAAGEELTFDYGSHAAGVSTRPCLCGDPHCRGRLPWDPAVS